MNQRQGLMTSSKELRQIADEIDNESIGMKDVMGELFERDDSLNIIVPIINTEDCSDTWRFEMFTKKEE